MSDHTGQEAPPGWPWWYGPVAFVGVFLMLSTLVAGLIAATGGDGTDSAGGLTLVATVIQGVALVGVALALASRTAPPRAWQFGLRRIPFWRGVGLTVLAVAGFYVLAGAYAVIFEPDGEQTVVEDLGAERSTLLLVASTVAVVGIAPFAEEFFFRGFFYGALRTRLGVASAALLDGLLFGAIHYSGPETLSVLPPLAVLGVVFCLLYERAGSLYPVIAFHALNNTIAFSVEADGSAVLAPVVGATVIALCVLAGSRQPRDLPLPFGERQWTAER